MHYFHYKGRELYCEDVPLSKLAVRFGTPLYVYSRRTILEHFLKLKDAFRQLSPLICYSVKANSNMNILKMLVEAGCGLDVVSGGELFRALRAGCPAKKIVYASVGKTPQEISRAVSGGILFFNVESLPELETINKIAGNLGKRAGAALRINPDVEPGTHKYITTGRLTNKFGIDFAAAAGIFATGPGRFPHVDLNGVHIHIGSQITSGAPFVKAIGKVLGFIAVLRKKKVRIEYLNLGGGLGIIYSKEKPQTALEYARKVIPLLKSSGLKIIMEPGRFIVGNAGVLVTKILYFKKTPLKRFVIVDAGMNDLIRPALYQAYHEILPLDNDPAMPAMTCDVVGPICESSDYLARHRTVKSLGEEKYLAVMSAGAYGSSMASNYNSRAKPAEIMVEGTKFRLIRERENYEDLIRHEK